MSPRWSTARIATIGSALAIGGSVAFAAPTFAAPGDARASAVGLEFSLELGRSVLLDVDAAVETKGPPGEVVIPDLATHLGSLTGAGIGGATTMTTASGAGATTSSALVQGLSVSVLGVEAVAAEEMSSSADCLPGRLPEAKTDSRGVTILGTPVDLAAVPPEGREIAASAIVPGMTSAEVIAKVLPGAASRNAASAEATALTVGLTLKGTVPEVGSVASIRLGNITIGDVSCDHLETPPAPTAEELLPGTGVTTGGETVTLRGLGFTGDTTVAVGGTAATDVVVVSDTELTFTTPANPAGPAAVTATTPSGTSGGLAFTYNEPAAKAPVLDVLDPDTVAATGGAEVWLFGSGFVRGRTSVTVGETVIAASNVEVLNTGTLIVKAPPHAAGLTPVSVTTPAGTSGTIDLEYSPVVAPPSITSVTPDSGPVEGNTVVTLRGTGFVQDATTVTMGTASYVDDGVSEDLTIVSDTELSFTVEAGTEGPVTIDVTTAAGTSNQVVYTYTTASTPPAPTAAALAPASGPAGGGTPVTVTGEGFVAGQTSVTVGGVVVPAASVRVASATQLSFTTPAHAAGSTDVVISTPNGDSNALSFSFLAAPPPPAGMRGHDFSGDGKADVLARDSSGRLWLYPGNGSGGWQPRVQVGSGWAVMTSIVAPGDLSGDGKADVLARDSSGRLWLYAGNGAGGWQPRVQVGSGWNVMSSIAGPGDFSGDGKADVLARDSSGVLWLYRGNGTGGWQPRVQVGAGWNVMSSIVGPGDLSGDGKVDVLARDSSGRLWLYPGNGAGGWQPRVQVGSGWNVMTGIVGPGDLSGDGKADVLARDSSGVLWLYRGNGAGGWQPRVQVGSGWNAMTSIL